MQTVMYRAPEVLFNEQDYGTPIDSWGIGLIMAEVQGWKEHRVRCRRKDDVRAEVVKTLLRCFHLAAAADLNIRPRLTGPPHEHYSIPWPDNMFVQLGMEGLNMLHGFVRWEPEHRWSPAAALECKFLHPEAMALAGRPADIPPSSLAKGLAGEASHKGSRHAWNIVAGCIAPDVLDWLRAEPALQMDSEAWKELGVTFHGHGTASANATWLSWHGRRACPGSGDGSGGLGKNGTGPSQALGSRGALARAGRTDYKTEFGRKFIKSGSVGGHCNTNSMCGLSLATALPLPRVQAWFRAWRYANGEPLCRSRVRCMGASRSVPSDSFLGLCVSAGGGPRRAGHAPREATSHYRRTTLGTRGVSARFRPAHAEGRPRSPSRR